MPTNTSTAPSGLTRASARDRLLAAADELFYAEGVHTVGIDRIIEHAGVAKASLYNTFGSKDELVRAYLSARHDRRRERITAAVAERDTPRERVLAVFDVLVATVSEPTFRGCAFARASAESDHAGTVREVTDAQRGWVRGLLTDLVREAGAPSPEALAEQLVLLYDGATTSAQLDGNQHAAVAARQLAETLLDAAASSAG